MHMYTAGARLLADGWLQRLCDAPSIETSELAPATATVDDCDGCGYPVELCQCDDDDAGAVLVCEVQS